MAKVRTAFLLSLLCLSASVWPITPAAANPRTKHEEKATAHVQKHAKHAHKKAYKGNGGPPPWAPAHGYRRKHGTGPLVYVPPFGIDAGTCNRKLIGAALGGTAGGLLASEVAKGSDRTAAIVGGTILGALMGGAVGDSMDQLDHRCVGQILEHGPSHGTVAWKNPDTDASYTVTPVETYESGDGRYCREYRTTATIGGKPQQTYGTACRQADGSWQLAN